MGKLIFNKELYPKSALLKAAYNFTDKAYIHLDADEQNYYVELKEKDADDFVSDDEFQNEMLAQCVRHEIFLQTKNIRELLLARAMATTVITSNDYVADELTSERKDAYSESSILKDWFEDE